MDEEWEILPHDGFLDYYGSSEEKRGFIDSKRSNSNNSKIVFNTNYFVCPSSPTKNTKLVPTQLVPVPIQLEPDPEVEITKEVIKTSIDTSLVPPVIIPKAKLPDLAPKFEGDQDSVSQVFFKKMKENEFVDMKLDSPTKSYPTTKGLVPPPHIDADADCFGFEEKIEAYRVDGLEAKISSPKKKKERESVDEKIVWEEENVGGLNLWKWSLTGLGAICTFGVAAVAFIIILGSHQRNSKHQSNNEKTRLQICSDDKGIKQEVDHATKWNEAISAARGVPVTRARITMGGHYDGL